MQYLNKVLNILFVPALLILASCAPQQVLKSGGKFAEALPRDSLIIEWKMVGAKYAVEKQERGRGLQKPTITQDEWVKGADKARDSINAIHKQLINELQFQLTPYLAPPKTSARYKLKIQLAEVVADVDGSRNALITVILTPYLEDRMLWYRQLDVFAAPSTTNQQLVKDCAEGILKELRSSHLVN